MPCLYNFFCVSQRQLRKISHGNIQQAVPDPQLCLTHKHRFIIAVLILPGLTPMSHFESHPCPRAPSWLICTLFEKLSKSLHGCVQMSPSSSVLSHLCFLSLGPFPGYPVSTFLFLSEVPRSLVSEMLTLTHLGLIPLVTLHFRIPVLSASLI